MDRTALMAFAAEHQGVFRTSDALALGGTRRMLDRLRRDGSIRLVGMGVHAVEGAPPTWRQKLLVSTWIAGPMARASHRSAAAVWGLGTGRGIEVLVPMGISGRHPGVRVHKTRFLVGSDVDERDGQPVTSVERTIIDLAAVVPMGRLARLFDTAIEREITTAERVLGHLQAMPTRGRTGVRALRILLAERIGMEKADFNPFERMTANLFAGSDLPVPVRQHALDLDGSRYYLDFAFPTYKVAVECDGMLGHRSASAQAYDLARQNAILADGWNLRRFGWSAVKDSPSETLATVRRALLASGWTPN